MLANFFSSIGVVFYTPLVPFHLFFTMADLNERVITADAGFPLSRTRQKSEISHAYNCKDRH